MSKEKIKGGTSIVYIRGDYIIKKIQDYFPECNILENEIKWLNILKDFDRVPNIIEVTKVTKEIKMNNLGERVSVSNLPSDWEYQMEYILSELEKYNCCHNDIKPKEILVKDGKLNLIDFGWATKKGDKIPEKFPEKIGSKFKYATHDFNDRYSFRKSIKYIIRKNRKR